MWLNIKLYNRSILMIETSLERIIWCILGFGGFWVLINWLDRNVFNKNRYPRRKKNEKK